MSAAALSYTINRGLCNTSSAKSSEESFDRHQQTHRFVRVCIPEPIHAEMAASDLRDGDKLIITAVVNASATTSVRGKMLNGDLIYAMPGLDKRARPRIKKFLKSSPHFGFIPGGKDTHSDFFFVKGFALAHRYHSNRSEPVQASVESAQHTSDVPCGLWCGDVVWRTVDFGLLDWMVETAKKTINWDRAEKEAKKSLEQVELVGVPECDDELLKEALANIKVKIGRNKKTAAKKRKKALSKARKQVAQIRLFERDPTANIKRKDGRLYTRLSSLPRWARRKYIRFISGRNVESVDIRAMYPWGLAAKLRQRRLRRGLCIESLDRLLEMIESGTFYEQLAQRAGVTTKQAKQSFAVLCLFGDAERDHWGRNSLWFALDAICPELCDEIAKWRRQTAGASRLAGYCQRLEGAIMLDGLVPAMADAGVPCCTIHDGCLVPEGCGRMAAQIIKDRAASLFGRPCAVKIEQH